jgi:hypothetical protein
VSELLFTSHPVLYGGTIDVNLGQGHGTMGPIVARNTLLGGAVLVNCLENERTVRKETANRSLSSQKKTMKKGT